MRLNPNQRSLLWLLAEGPRRAPDLQPGRENECVASLKRLRKRGLVSTPHEEVSTWTTLWTLTDAGGEAIGK